MTDPWWAEDGHRARRRGDDGVSQVRVRGAAPVEVDLPRWCALLSPELPVQVCPQGKGSWNAGAAAVSAGADGMDTATVATTADEARRSVLTRIGSHFLSGSGMCGDRSECEIHTSVQVLEQRFGFRARSERFPGTSNCHKVSKGALTWRFARVVRTVFSTVRGRSRAVADGFGDDRGMSDTAAPDTERPESGDKPSSFAKSLFAGALPDELVFPYPTLSRDESKKVHGLIDSAHEFLDANYDPSRSNSSGWVGDDIIRGLGERGLLGLYVAAGVRRPGPVADRVLPGDGGVRRVRRHACRWCMGVHQSIGMKPIHLFGIRRPEGPVPARPGRRPQARRVRPDRTRRGLRQPTTSRPAPSGRPTAPMCSTARSAGSATATRTSCASSPTATSGHVALIVEKRHRRLRRVLPLRHPGPSGQRPAPAHVPRRAGPEGEPAR